MTTTEGLRYIDSDGHILEHPTAMPDYAPAEYRDRVWHIETDENGVEHLHYNGIVMPSNGLSLAGTAGFPDEKVDQVRNGEIRYSEVRPAAYNAKARLQSTWTPTASTSRCCTRRRCWGCSPSPTRSSPGSRPAPTTTGRRTTPRRVRAGCSRRARCRR